MSDAPKVPAARADTGTQILDDVLAAFRMYTVQPSGHAYIALTIYSAFTRAAGCFDFAPRLVLTSAEKRSGKTRTMEVVSTISAKPLIAANATVPALFRSLGGDTPPTICLDEADTIFGTRIKAEQNEDLRGMLNAGFQRGTPVLRTVGPTHEVAEFPTFAPAVLAAIGQLPDTITDRAVNIRLRRRKATESVAQYRIRRDRPVLLDLRERLAEWLAPHHEALAHAEPETPLEDRAADVWEPLFAVADLAGGDWPAVTRRAALYLAAEAAENDTDQSEGIELLADIRDVLKLVTGEFVQSTNLLTLLKAKEESRWSEYDLSARRLSDLLKAYQIRPRRAPSGNGRGYSVRLFEDVFARYLPDTRPEPTEATETPSDQVERSVTSEPSVTSKRQTPESDSGVSPGQTPNLSHLSVSDAPRPENRPRMPGCKLSDRQLDQLPDVACDECGKPVRGRYTQFNGPTCPSCRQAKSA